jgi:putative ABC transport system ATP-binding protein
MQEMNDYRSNLIFDVALKVENLSKVYISSMGKVVSLRNVSFSVNKGEFVSVVGPSGSGKSTLLNMIGALDRPTSGKVFINGIDIFSLNDSQIATMRNDTLGFIFQSYNLINRTTVLKNVEFPGITGGMSNSDRRHRALKLLNFLGIGDKAKYKPTNLSGTKSSLTCLQSIPQIFILQMGDSIIKCGSNFLLC